MRGDVQQKLDTHFDKLSELRFWIEPQQSNQPTKTPTIN